MWITRNSCSYAAGLGLRETCILSRMPRIAPGVRDVMSARFALLALPSEGPKHSLQLREELEARTGGAWPLNVGHVYTTLQRLERDALLESCDARPAGPQKGFRITADGERELAGWLRTPPDLASPLHDELAAKIL